MGNGVAGRSRTRGAGVPVGVPLVTHLFMPDPDVREAYNRAVPVDDLARFGGPIGGVVERLVGLARSATDPAAYAQRLVNRLCPTTLPYELDTPAGFDFVGFNGRGRDGPFGPPPAQIRTGPIKASGSYLGFRGVEAVVPRCHARRDTKTTRRSGSASGTWPVSPRSPWSIPFPPPPPPASGRCSAASSVLWDRPTSHRRACRTYGP